MTKQNKYLDELRANIQDALDNSGMADYLRDESRRIAGNCPTENERNETTRLDTLTGPPSWTPSMDVQSEHPQRTPKQDSQFPLDRLDRCGIYLSGIYEGLETWPNLVENGLTEMHLGEALEAREANGIPKGTFREDMDILEHAFADPEWVRATVKKSSIGLIKASIANGAPTPRPGYESPVKARQRAARAQLEELEKAAKELEDAEFELWQLQLSDDERWMILNTHKLEQERIWLRAEFTKRRKADGQD